VRASARFAGIHFVGVHFVGVHFVGIQLQNAGPDFTVNPRKEGVAMRLLAQAVQGVYRLKPALQTLNGLKPALQTFSGLKPLLRAAAVALLIVLPVGCNLLPPIEEPLPEGQIVSVTGVGQASPEQPPVVPRVVEGPAGPALPKETLLPLPAAVVRRPGRDFPSWASEKIRVDVSVPFPTGANSHVQALMLARRGAGDQALRELAARVSALSSPRGGTVGDILEQRDDLRQEVEGTLRNQAEIAPGEEGGSSYRASAALPLQGIALIVFGEVREAGAAGPEKNEEASGKSPASNGRRKSAASVAESRRAAREKALEQARARLFEKVKETPLSANSTIGTRIQQDPFLAAYVRGAVENARVEKVAYPDDRTCEATLSLDVQPLVRRLTETPR